MMLFCEFSKLKKNPKNMFCREFNWQHVGIMVFSHYLYNAEFDSNLIKKLVTMMMMVMKMTSLL